MATQLACCAWRKTGRTSPHPPHARRPCVARRLRRPEFPCSFARSRLLVRRVATRAQGLAMAARESTLAFGGHLGCSTPSSKPPRAPGHTGDALTLDRVAASVAGGAGSTTRTPRRACSLVAHAPKTNALGMQNTSTRFGVNNCLRSRERWRRLSFGRPRVRRR